MKLHVYQTNGIRKEVYFVTATTVMQEIWMKPSQDGKDSVKLPFSNYFAFMLHR